MKKLRKKNKKKIGQITIKRIGDCYAVCIGGNPKEIFKVKREAEDEVKDLRKFYGRRHFPMKKRSK